MGVAHEINDLGLKGRAILVTGAGRGLGRAYALALGRLGANVMVHDAGVDQDGQNPDSSRATGVAAEVTVAGGTAEAADALLDGEASCRDLVAATLDRFGRLDGLIHNAGLVLWCDTAAVDLALYERITAVSNEAAFWLCSAALPAMRTQGFGRIVLTSSGWALTPNEGSGELALYCHGKGAQFGLAMGLAQGAGHPNIRTNVIAPVANTRIFRATVPDDSLRPEAVAGAVAWLASPACTLTGALIRARDGSLTLSRVTDLASRDLRTAADDPVAAGAALTELAQHAEARGNA